MRSANANALPDNRRASNSSFNMLPGWTSNILCSSVIVNDLYVHACPSSKRKQRRQGPLMIIAHCALRSPLSRCRPTHFKGLRSSSERVMKHHNPLLCLVSVQTGKLRFSGFQELLCRIRCTALDHTLSIVRVTYNVEQIITPPSTPDFVFRGRQRCLPRRRSSAYCPP
jgi:hypothetical protein